MGKINYPVNYQKILQKLVEDEHHALNKIERVVADSKINDIFVYAHLSFKEIVNDKEWDASEKERLLRLFGYEKYEHKLEYDEYNHKKETDAFIHMIKFDNLSGFTAYMNCFKDIERHYVGTYITKDEAYRRILNTINNQASDEYIDNWKVKYSKKLTKEQELEFMKVALSILSEEDKKRLCADFYEAYFLKDVSNESIFINIIKTGNIELIDEYVPYIDNVSAYLSYAVDTGNIEVVRHFIADLGADINYYPKEGIYGLLTPLKRAITNNDYEMFAFLYDNGADVNLAVLEEDFIGNIHNTSLEIFDRWNHIHLKRCKEDDEDVKYLQYLRTSTPLEYAITISKYNYSNSSNYLISFEGFNNYIEINNSQLTEKQTNRAKIVNLLFEKADKGEYFNATNLICTALITRDNININKYIDYIIENKIEVNINKIFNLFLYLNLDEYKVLTSILVEFVERYSENSSEIFKKLFDIYLENTVKRDATRRFILNNFTSALLNRINSSEQKNIILMPYVGNIDTAKKLLELGFDINQINEKGQNILFGLLHNIRYKFSYGYQTDKEKELFDFLTTINPETKKRLIDLSHRDNDNKNALFYALKKIDTKDEYEHGSKEKVYTYTDFEGFIADFIDILPTEEVNNNDVMEVLETRMTEYCSKFGERIHADFVYQHHKKLMTALRRKMVFSDKIYQEILEKLYPTDEKKLEVLNSRVQLDPSLDFVYEVLDRNTKIQKISIDNNFDSYINYLGKTNASFEDFLCVFKKLIDDIDNLQQFYEQNVCKRYNVEKYLDYVKNKYNVSYKNLSSYILRMILFGIKRFGSENLPLLLELCPFFDVNTIVYNEDIEMSYYQHLDEISEFNYDEECLVISENRFEAKKLKIDSYDNILFTGALIHYGFLINDLKLVEYLKNIGASVKLVIDNENHSFDYVNSDDMFNLLGPDLISEIDSIGEDGFTEEERKYLLDL